MNKKKIITLVIAILILALFGCATKKEIKIWPSTKPTYVGKDNKTSAGGATYTGSGFTSTPKDKLKLGIDEKDKGAHNIYNVAEGNPFTGSFLIDNHDRRREYAVIALLDYKQVPLSLKGKYKWLHYITMGQNEKKAFSMKTTPIKKGIHDFIIVDFWSPRNHSLETEVRQTSEMAFGHARANISTKNDRSFPKATFITKYNLDNKDNSFGGYMINSGKNPRLLEKSIKTKPSKNISFYIHLDNDSKKSVKYAINAFLDYRQVKIEGKDALFVKVGPKKRFMLKQAIKAPAKPGTYELVVLFTANPFIKLPGKNEKQQIDDFTYSSTRIAIIVKK